ncbi:tRNA (adenosine(37)-N6)-dimethylallyltransferase MiaA [Candidatus Wolfebacteria bacterium]|nr:tRNA (adenosine(37)-N6)-dimethylallyltransferase MiaA [Candidatus Wolfebacteria bacterium]
MFIRLPHKLIVILGPTASGKSELAVKLALQLSSWQAKKLYEINGAEIISADSRQVYKGLNIGSGKITKKEMKNVPHHLLDVASPKKTFTVSQYQKLAKKALKKIIKKNKLPVICGGTGLYIDALIYGKEFPEVPPQLKLRKKLEKKSTEKLFKQLQKLDLRRAQNIDKHNRRRLIRALEIIITTKKPVPNIATIDSSNISFAHILKIGIKKSPEKLKKLIAKRLKKRLKQGLIKEVKNLHYKQNLSWQRLDNFGLEYRYISRYLAGLISKTEMIQTLENEIYRYAKRQMTWFKKDKNIIWINSLQKAFSIIRDWLGL